jgi:hypothetical protein
MITMLARNIVRVTLLTGLLLVGGACLSRADVTRMDEIGTGPKPPAAAYSIFTVPSSEFRSSGAVSGCIGIYPMKMETLVFRSVCQGISTGDFQEGSLLEAHRNQPDMVFSAPVGPLFGSGYAAAGISGLRQTDEKFPSSHSIFNRLTALSSSELNIDLSISYADVGSKPKTFNTRQAGGQLGSFETGEPVYRFWHGGERRHPRKPIPDGDGDDGGPVVPEPATLLLLGTGTLLLGAVLRRRLVAAA